MLKDATRVSPEDRLITVNVIMDALPYYFHCRAEKREYGNEDGFACVIPICLSQQKLKRPTKPNDSVTQFQLPSMSEIAVQSEML